MSCFNSFGLILLAAAAFSYLCAFNLQLVPKNHKLIYKKLERKKKTYLEPKRRVWRHLGPFLSPLPILNHQYQAAAAVSAMLWMWWWSLIVMVVLLVYQDLKIKCKKNLLVKRRKRKKNIKRATSGGLLSFAAHLGTWRGGGGTKNTRRPFRPASGGGGMVRNTKYI